MTELRNDWVKIVDFLIKAYFWFTVHFFAPHLTIGGAIWVPHTVCINYVIKTHLTSYSKYSRYVFVPELYDAICKHMVVVHSTHMTKPEARSSGKFYKRPIFSKAQWPLTTTFTWLRSAKKIKVGWRNRICLLILLP